MAQGTMSAKRDILSMLCLAGEYPMDKLWMCPSQSESAIERAVYRLINDGVIGIAGTRSRAQSESRALKRTSKNEGAIRSIRLRISRHTEDGEPVIYETIRKELGQEYLDNYLRISGNHTMSADKQKIYRRHRVAEIMTMCKRANIEVRPWCMPDLENSESKITGRCFYDSIQIKDSVKTENYDIRNARLHGLIVSPGGAYVTYNIDKSLMNGTHRIEHKSTTACSSVLNLHWEPPYKLGRNRRMFDAVQSVVIGADYDVALRVLREAESKKSRYLNLFKVYDDVYFIPQDNNGVSILKMITSENWRDRMIRAIIRPEMINSRGRTCDTLLPDGTNILACFDGNITLLKLLKSTLKKPEEKHLLLCFDWQEEFLRTYFGDKVGIRSYPTERILSEFERGD